MPQFDLSLDELRVYRPPRDEPAGFDRFWADTLEASRQRSRPPVFAAHDARLRTIEVADVTFSGYQGQPIKGWLRWPRGARGPLPAIVEFVGYGGGRGLAQDRLLWASAGYAHFVMDVRGQGGSWSTGDTSDIEPVGTGPQYPGVMTRGILDPASYYYRRLMTDAILAVDVVRGHAVVDPARVIVAGASQGGGLALAAAAFAGPAAALVDVPFLCHFRRALEITDAAPYDEIRRFLRVHRSDEARVFATLGYFDGRHLAARATAPALFAVGLEDEITPPSTVFAAFNAYGGPAEIRVWPYSGHEAAEDEHRIGQLDYLTRIGLGPAAD
jgi:cephalosporin-C deacetylase